MQAISYSSARKHLATTMTKVCDDHDPIIITRQNNEAVVMMSLEDYEALTETAYLLRSKNNMKRLLRSIEEIESTGGTERNLVE